MGPRPVKRTVGASASTGQPSKRAANTHACFFSVSEIPTRNLWLFPVADDSHKWVRGSDVGCRASVRFLYSFLLPSERNDNNLLKNRRKWRLLQVLWLRRPLCVTSFSCNVKHCPLAQSSIQFCELTVESFCKAPASSQMFENSPLLPVLVSKSWSLALVTITISFACSVGCLNYVFTVRDPLFPCFLLFMHSVIIH